MLTVNEDAEILARLGVLTSNLESPHKISLNGKAAAGRNAQNSKEDGCYISSDDDEESDVNIVYVKQRLLGDEQPRKITKRRSNGTICRNVLLAASFIALGISTSVQSITLPNIAVNVHASSLLFVLNVLCLTAIGFLVGCAVVSRLFMRMNPVLLLLFSVFGTVLFTALLGFSKTASAVYIFSFTLGCFHGTVFRGGLIILYGSGFGTRTLFAVHAFFAAGAVIISLLSVSYLSGAAVPYSHVDNKLSTDDNLLLLIKRETTDLYHTAKPDNSSVMKYNTSQEGIKIATATTSKPMRPDHVVGVESIAEPKTQENEQKRKEAEDRAKATEEGQSIIEGVQEQLLTTTTNASSLQSNGVPVYEGHSQNQSSVVQESKRSTSHPMVSTPSLLYGETAGVDKVRNIELTGTASDSNTASTPYLMTQSISTAAAASNSTLYDMLYSFAKVNWRLSNIASSSIWSWEELEQKFGPFRNFHMAYVLATFLGFCCLIPYFIAAACCSSCYITVPDLQIAKLQAAPELTTDGREMNVSWRFCSGVFLLLTGGTELIIGESLTFYALSRPELNLSQRNGLLLTSTFWFGIFAARIPSVLMTKFISISRLSNIVLLSTIVAGYIVVNMPSLLAFHCTLFVLGLSMGPLAPSLLCWLDEQELSSRLSLSLLYSVGISLGRLTLPLFIALFIHSFSTSIALFVIACLSLFIAYIALIVTARTVRAVARLSAINHLSNAVDESAQGSTVEIVEQKKTRNGKYVALIDESDVKCDVYTEEEEEEEDADDDDFDKDFMLDEQNFRKI